MLASIHFTKIFRQHRRQKFRVLDLRQGITDDMFPSLKYLISERGFDSFRDGLEARFKANHLSFRIHYSENSPMASLLVRLESAERVGEVCVWESGHCDITAASLADAKIKDQHVVIETAEDFHAQLAALFLFVTKRADNLKPE